MIDASEYCRNKKQKTSTKAPKNYMVTFLFLYIHLICISYFHTPRMPFYKDLNT